MCDPASALAGASLAVGTATAVAGFAGKQDDAVAIAQAQAHQALAAEVDRNLKYNLIQQRQGQEMDAASAALLSNETRALKAGATAEVQAADAGIAGNSVESVARDYFRQQGAIDSTTVRNTDMSVQQLQEEKQQAEAQRAQRSTFAPVKLPSLASLGLEIAGAGVQAYGVFDRATNARAARTNTKATT